MAFIFPEDKADFTAPNGVTYHWDGTKWVTKTFKADESALEDYVTKDDLEVDQEKQDVAWASDQEKQDDAFAADQEAQDQLIADNKRSIEQLQVTKGPVARYETKGTDFYLSTRNGELYVNSATAADVTLISLAAFDTNGNPTRPVGDGDIIEFVEAAAKSTGQLSRFRVTKGDDPQALEVVYLNGNNNFEVGHIEEVYIYPQNEETASKEYVDDNFLPLTGGELSGSLRIKNGEAKTHPQWKVSPNGGSDYATNIYGLEGQLRLRTSHTGSEGHHDGSHIVLDPDVAGAGANQTTKIYKVPIPHRDDMASNKGYVDTTVAESVDGLATEEWVDQQIQANAGTDYTLPTATTSTKGGVTSATNSGTYVPCTKMANTGSTIGVVQSTNNTQGVNYKGQACVTSNSTPAAGDYQQGALIFSTSTNSLYIRT